MILEQVRTHTRRSTVGFSDFGKDGMDVYDFGVELDVYGLIPGRVPFEMEICDVPSIRILSEKNEAAYESERKKSNLPATQQDPGRRR